MSFDDNMYFDKDGKPMTRDAWVAAQTPEYKRVAETTLIIERKKVWISTVWIGLDMGMGTHRTPVIFETMVFYDGAGDDDEMDRYCTLEGALKGHKEMVRLVQAKADVRAKARELGK